MTPVEQAKELLRLVRDPRSRQTGRTSELAANVNRMEGVLVCESYHEAKVAREVYKCKTLAMYQIPGATRGMTNTPIFVDHHVWENMVQELCKEVDTLAEMLAMTQHANQVQLERLRSQRDRLFKALQRVPRWLLWLFRVRV